MSIFESSPSPWTDRMLSILRIVAGLVFFVTGTMKAFGFPPFPTVVPPLPMPPMWEFHVVGFLETYLGAAFTLGLLPRPISFVLAGEMAPYHDVTEELADFGVFGRSSRSVVSRVLDVDDNDLLPLAPYGHISRPFSDVTVIIARVPEI